MKGTNFVIDKKWFKYFYPNRTGLPVEYQRNGLSEEDIRQINKKYKCESLSYNLFFQN